MGVRLQESFLSSLFNECRLSKESSGNSKDPWTVSAHDLLEGAFVSFASQADQFQLRSLFDLDCQSNSRSQFKTADPKARACLHSYLDSFLGSLLARRSVHFDLSC